MTIEGEHALRPSLRRVGVIGAGGQLGRCLTRAIGAAEGLELAFSAERADLDLALLERVPDFMAAHCSDDVDVVVNAAAYTAVDRCESEAELAYCVNALAPAELARGLRERGIGFIHISTDYVFRGDAERAYLETDETEPRTVYGKTKRAGELAVLGTDPTALVVRTSWLFGPGRNFVITMLEQASRRIRGETSDPLRVVDDQHGAPTSARDLADALVCLIVGQQPGEELPPGLLHLRNAGETTWYGFAREILSQAGYAEMRIEPVSSDLYPTAAQRPAHSVLDCGRATSLGIEMRPWTEALTGYLRGPDLPEALLAAARGVSASEPSSSHCVRPEVNR